MNGGFGAITGDERQPTGNDTTATQQQFGADARA